MSEQTVTITVNGTEIQAAAGTRLLDVLRDMGLDIPTLCHDDRLTPYGGCRLCVVERKDGRGGLIPSCSTPVQRGMVIETETPEVIESRRKNLQLMVLNHRMECPVCERNGDCRFQELIYLYGIDEELLPFDLVRRPRDESSPVIVRDPEKCILCGRCVRLCDEIQGVAEIGLIHRGLQATVSTLLDRPLDCEFCGQCVNACPVGALIARPYSSEVPVWLRERRTTTCSFCPCGCQIDVELHQGCVVRVTSTPGVAPNDGNLCVKGWLGWDAVCSPERLTRPMLRREGRLEPVGWDDALHAVAAAAMRARSNDLARAAVVTPRLLTEDALLVRQLLAEGLGGGMLSLGPEAGVRALVEGVAPVLGRPVSTGTVEDLRRADMVLVLRGDPGRTHPLVKNELVRRHRQDELEFALAATVTGGLERHARPFLRLLPAGELALLGALSWELVEAGRIAPDLPGAGEWVKSLEPYGGEAGAELTGVPAEKIRSLAGTMARAESVLVVVVTGRGLPGDEAKVAAAAASLVAALGEGARLLVLPEKSNVQGCVLAGMAQDSPSRVLEEARAGRLGWLYLVGQDPAGVWPREYRVRDALESAGFVVVQDAFLTETARCADVVLPAAILLERSGTGIAADGRFLSYRRILDPPGEARQDAEIVRGLAARLGVTVKTADVLSSDLRGLVESGNEGRRLRALPPPERAPRSRGFLLDPSPQLFHSGSTTRRSALLEELSPSVAVRLSPRDAQELGVVGGQAVRLVQDGTEVLLRARLDRRVPQGVVAAPWVSRGDGASRLIKGDGEVVTVELRRS